MHNLYILSNVAPYGTNHLMLLVICLILMIILPIIIKKTNISFNKILNIMLILWIISETIKLCSNVSYLLSDGSFVKIIEYEAKEGITIVRAFYPREELPFHLCSIQPIFMLIIKFSKSIKTQNIFKHFMFPTCLLGAFIALLVPTIDCEFTNPQVYEYFLFHTALIVFAISLVITKQINITFKSHLETLTMLIIMFIASIWINTLCSNTGQPYMGLETDEIYYTNFFFSMKPPMDGLPLLNLNHGWFMYLLNIVALGVTLITLLQLPFIIKNHKNKISQN